MQNNNSPTLDLREALWNTYTAYAYEAEARGDYFVASAYFRCASLAVSHPIAAPVPAPVPVPTPEEQVLALMAELDQYYNQFAGE